MPYTIFYPGAPDTAPVQSTSTNADPDLYNKTQKSWESGQDYIGYTTDAPGDPTLTGRILAVEGAQFGRVGTPVSSSTSITPSTDGTIIPVTGSTEIQLMTAQTDRVIVLHFVAGLTIRKLNNLKLVSDYTALAGDTITLYGDGADWWEVARSRASMVFGTPAVVLSTTNAAGSATSGLRTDAQIAIFDATVPTTQAVGDSAVVGTATFAARRDHKHAMPAFGIGATNVTAGNDSRLSDSRTPTGSASGDVMGTYPSSLTVPYLPRLTRVSTDVAYAATTTLATVTGLAQTVTTSITYAIEVHLYVTADAAGGQKYALAGTATATALVLDTVIGNLTTPGATASRTSALASAVALAGSGDTVYEVTLRGTITVNAGGTLLVQAAQNSASGTTIVLRGSTFALTPVA